jgi:hypothetical protein
MDFDAIVDELYGLPPEDFVEAREGRVKAARAEGDRELASRVHGLRRPTVSAWLVNLLVHEAGAEVDQLMELGAALREAQASLSGEELRQLSGQRRQVIEALARRVRRLAADAEHPVNAEVQREVESTLESALADPDAAAAVGSGRLTAPLRYTGFGPIDTSSVLAAPPRRRGGTKPDRGGARQVEERPDKRPAKRQGAAKRSAEDKHRETEPQEEERRRAEVRQARDDVREARRADREAADLLAKDEDAVSAASDRQAAAGDAIERLTRELEDAREEHTAAGRAVRAAEKERDKARRAAESAHRALAAAQDELDRLQG